MTADAAAAPAYKLRPLGQVIADHGLKARKSLGQNFLLDPTITGRIARAAGDLTGTTVIEVWWLSSATRAASRRWPS